MIKFYKYLVNTYFKIKQNEIKSELLIDLYCKSIILLPFSFFIKKIVYMLINKKPETILNDEIFVIQLIYNYH